MTIRRLDRAEWSGFCIHVSRDFLGRWANIEIASLQIGSQIEAHHLPLLGMVYDPRSDVLEVLVGELDHLIRSPREFYVDEEAIGILSLQIIDADGARQIVTLHDPPMLPAPAHLQE